MCLQFFAGLDKARGDFGKREAQQRGAGGEDEIEPARDCGLVPAVDLAQAALGAVAVDGVADRGPGGDHAHAGRADVEVDYGATDLRLEVRDDGRGTHSGSDGLGHGLVGIGERVKIYGGEMTAGAGRTGGFLLRVRLPLDDGGDA